MIGFFSNTLLALVWITLTGSLTTLNFLLGFLVGYLVLTIVQNQIPIIQGYSKRVPRFFSFATFFIKQLLKANLKVALNILSPRLRIHPGVIALPLQAQTDVEITLLANVISLTPGTLSLDVSDDRKVLFIHAMFLQDEKKLIHDLHEIERRILSVLR